jgi:hypothetical protein
MQAIVRLVTSENWVLGLVVVALAALIWAQVSSLESHLSPVDPIGPATANDPDTWEPERKRSLELMEYNRLLLSKLQQDEVGLAEAAEDYVRANRARYCFVRAVQALYPASSLEESAALNLICMVENGRRRQTGLPTEAAELRQQYTEWFGHPPRHHCLQTNTCPPPERPGSSCER